MLVNATRRMLSLPVAPGNPFFLSPAGRDPMAEYPPTTKLLIAAGIKVFGDDPLGWRIMPLVCGVVALLGLYWLTRSLGAGPWLAVGAVAIMATDNLVLVQSRMPTPDIVVLAFMLVGAALYLRGHPLAAGVVLGMGVTAKLVGAWTLVALVVFEALVAARPAPGNPDARAHPFLEVLSGPLGSCIAVSAAVYLALSAVIDRAVALIPDPIANTLYMVRFELRIGPFYAASHADWTRGINSPAWDWLLNRKVIDYYTQYSKTDPTRAVIHFRGEVNPFIIGLAIPALAFAAVEGWRRRDRVSQFAVAWWIATFFPFVLGSAAHAEFIYYILIALPAVYLALAKLFSSRWLPRWIAALYGGALLVGVWALFPFR
jgi:dolichyl-phosphate-mannose-protein mannosyltransferase